MGTKYLLDCTSSGKTTQLRIKDNFDLIGFNDTWEAVTAEDWDVPNGNVTSFGGPDPVKLSTGTGQFHELYSFTKNTKIGDKGKGTKVSLEGNFPAGEFDWECVSKT
ncbi:hypothetical protein L0244_40710 [bacterium]|nr:hypothetical protein [bacterium]